MVEESCSLGGVGWCSVIFEDDLRQLLLIDACYQCIDFYRDMLNFRLRSKFFWSVVFTAGLAVLSSCGDAQRAGKADESPEFAKLHSEVVEKGEHPALRAKKRKQKEVELHGVDLSTPPVGFVHLSADVRAKIDAGFDAGGAPAWSGVVIHTSGEDGGSAAAFRYHHERVLKFADGMVYHFVIGNGNGTPDGTVEVGSRWINGLRGDGVNDGERSPRIEICLVGDFHDDGPTKAQLEALRELLAKFESRLGEFSAAHCLGHDEVEFNRRPCPGRYFPLEAVKSRHGGSRKGQRPTRL